MSTGLRMAMMASGQHADVDSVAPDAPRVPAALEEVRRQYRPHHLTSAAMDPSFVKAVAGQSSQGSASWTSAPGGGVGGVAHPLTSRPPVSSNHHKCYLYIFIYECMYKYPAPPPPPRHGQFDRHVGIKINFLGGRVQGKPVIYGGLHLFRPPATRWCKWV